MTTAAQMNGPHFFFQENTKDWHNDDIAGSDKSGFSDSRIFDSKLLKITCQADENTTGDSTGKQSFSGCFSFCFGLDCLWFLTVHKPDDRKEHQRTDQRSHRVKGKAFYIIHSDTLRYEGNAPDGSSEQKNK
jgi:hypothetical protein